MRVEDIISKLEYIALANNKRLYIEYGADKLSERLEFIFLCPVTGKGKRLKIMLDEVIDDDRMFDSIENEVRTLGRKPKIDYRALPSVFPEEDPIVRYCKEDVKQTLNMYYGMRRKLQIEKVIFNDPATIIFWTDGTKTVVKAQDGEPYDPEKGMAMAISKKFLGNKHEYYEEFMKWVGRYEKQQRKKEEIEATMSDAVKALKNVGEKFNKIW